MKSAKVALWDWSGTIVSSDNSLNSDSAFWLEWFSEHNVKQGVISNESDHSYLSKCVEKLCLSCYFHEGSYVISAGLSYLPKPSTDMFEVLMRRMGQQDESSLIYIGDSGTDEQFAKNCGCEFIHIRELKDRPATIMFD